MKKLSWVLVSALLLTGCATTANTSERPSASPSAQPDGWAFCAAFVPDMQTYVDYILSAAAGQVDVNEHASIGRYIEAMRAEANGGIEPLVEDYASPFDAIDAVVTAGGGTLALNTDAFKASVLPLTSYCTGVGYKLNP